MIYFAVRRETHGILIAPLNTRVLRVSSWSCSNHASIFGREIVEGQNSGCNDEKENQEPNYAKGNVLVALRPLAACTSGPKAKLEPRTKMMDSCRSGTPLASRHELIAVRSRASRKEQAPPALRTPRS